jgi:COPII coat assembly protein SEC16
LTIDLQTPFQSQPTISLGNTMTNKFNDENSPGEKHVEENNAKTAQPKHQSTEKTKKAPSDDGNHSHNSGWFGGLFNKLSMKPKNQMILPDDKNPTVIQQFTLQSFENIADKFPFSI